MTATKAPVDRAKIQAFAKAAEAMCRADQAKRFPNITSQPIITVDFGKKRARIVKNGDHQCRSAYCFVDYATGDILMAASWKAPARHARGNINTPTHGVEFVTPYGAQYLR